MQSRTLRFMVGTVILSFLTWGCVPLQLLSESKADVQVTMSPTAMIVQEGQSQQFSARVSGTSNTALNWSVNSVPGGNTTVGTVTDYGLYTAPLTRPNSPAVSIVAVSQANTAKSATALATIVKL